MEELEPLRPSRNAVIRVGATAGIVHVSGRETANRNDESRKAWLAPFTRITVILTARIREMTFGDSTKDISLIGR